MYPRRWWLRWQKRCLAQARLGDRADHCQRLVPAAETRFDPCDACECPWLSPLVDGRRLLHRSVQTFPQSSSSPSYVRARLSSIGCRGRKSDLGVLGALREARVGHDADWTIESVRG